MILGNAVRHPTKAPQWALHTELKALTGVSFEILLYTQTLAFSDVYEKPGNAKITDRINLLFQ